MNRVYHSCDSFLFICVRSFFQVSPKGNIDIYGTERVNLVLKLTVPFACRGGEPCPLYAVSHIPGTQNPPCQITTIKFPKCGAEFRHDEDEQYQNISIQAVVGDNFNALDQDFAIFLQLFNPYHPFMHGNRLDTIRVSNLNFYNKKSTIHLKNCFINIFSC